MPRRERPEDVLVLGYHGISADWPEPLAVKPEALESSLEHLLTRGWVGTTFTDALSGIAGRRLAVTFDDACRSVLASAYPVMERLGIPGTVFVPTAYADTADLMTFGTLARWVGTQWEDELRCMSWSELRILVHAGWEVGSHTETHAHLSRPRRSGPRTGAARVEGALRAGARRGLHVSRVSLQ